MSLSFTIASTPQLIFGSGKIKELPKVVRSFGRNVVLLIGKNSFISSPHWKMLKQEFDHHRMEVFHFIVEGEPSPAHIDNISFSLTGNEIDVAVAIGGGSVLDAGKAVAAMVGKNDSVKNYLEGVGSKEPDGSTLPFVAVPTTSGTGSECTKNAVISEVGENGFKKSLRHDNFVPNIALVDPELTLSCPLPLSAMVGMDAFTQLLESYVSVKASPITDALALDGLKHVSISFEKMMKSPDDIEAREGMSYASMLGGITLANAGLGTVHGFASTVGGRYDIPHGVVCSKLMYPCNEHTIRILRNENDPSFALKKYAEVGRLFSTLADKSDDFYIDHLLDTIKRFDQEYCQYRFSDFGFEEKAVSSIAKGTGNKNNPVKLSTEQLAYILSSVV